MQQQHYPTFTATPHGVMMDGALLTKLALRNIPPETLHEIEGIETLIKQVKKEEWNKPVLYAGGEYPLVVLTKMRAALLSPQPFPLASSKPLAKAGFSPDEPRDERGRWTDSDGDPGEPRETHIEHYEPVAYTTRRGSRVAPNRYVSAKDGVTEADLQNPRFNGMDNTQIKKQKFVDANLADAEKGAKQLNVPVENLLALSGLESGWGRGDPAKDGNNFFGLHHPASFETGSRPAYDNPDVRIAQFASYSNSMRSFIEDYGYFVQDVFNPKQFARNLQNAGKFGIDKYGRKVPDYVDNVAGTANHIGSSIASTRRACK